jgi:SAM-dependent methyltransferase
MAGDLPVFAPDLAAGGAGDADYRLDALTQAEQRHFWFVSRFRLIAWAISRYFPSCRSLLDVGCGTGGVLAALQARLPGVRLEAADALTSALHYAAKRLPGVAFAQADIGRLPYDQEFDVIGAFDVIEHLDDDERALREMFRASAPGGGLVVTVPQHPFLWSAVDQFSHHRRRYTRRELQRKLIGAGFRIERMTSFTTLLLPALMAARLTERNPETFDPVAELRIGAATNALFRLLSDIEHAAIRAGLSFPAGGSLLAVARRP